MNSYFLQSALLPQGWQHRVRITTADGIIQSVETNVTPAADDQALGVVIPAMPNVHSHVFQRAMAGLSEYQTTQEINNQTVISEDSFWSWRDLMYQLANQISSDELFTVAKTCYQAMQEAGYASVCEFHYVHRDKDQPDNFYRHSEILLNAADEVGLPITLLPVLYTYSGINQQPLKPEQHRFELSVDEYIQLYQHLASKLKAKQHLGICFHSIRAVSSEQMHRIIDALPQEAPIHIHIAEQTAEVEQSIEYHGVRPITWLFNNFTVNSRWHLVHATHMTDEEIRRVAQSGATVVLCPLTEANLGDGIFPMPAYKKYLGNWAIGSDSNIELKPQGELKMLEYSQRLMHHKRNICADTKHPHVGTWMWLQAVRGGNQASGHAHAGLEVGMTGAAMVLDKAGQHSAAQVLDSWLFADQVKAKTINL